MSIGWWQSRYDKTGPGGGDADYINCPMDESQYCGFIAALLNAEKTEFKAWEEHALFRRLPAHRGDGGARRRDAALRTDEAGRLAIPSGRRKPHAVVQLRQDNALGSLWNMVGFQTKLKHGEQVRIFRTIPALREARLARLGGIHRNTFLNSPKLLDATLRLKADKRLRFAGQITGVKGYVESAAIGLIAGRFAAAERLLGKLAPPPPTTALGALLNHITGGHLSADGDGAARSFQPMNVNFGLFPEIVAPPAPRGKGPRSSKGFERKRALAARALADLEIWLAHKQPVAAE